jgi:ubiquinone/menaquinone biosynthesis C-methylase UbiE
MRTATALAGLSGIKARQQETWASGDFAVIAARIVLVSERLADAAGLRAGWRVLDVACGNGNATLAAARCGAHALGVDYVPELLEGGRERAAAERLDIEFRLGDAEDLPVPDASFDAVLSVFGAMFAPDHRRTAHEIIRVTRPGGTVGLASWTPDGFVGEMFGVIARHVPGPPGIESRCSGALHNTWPASSVRRLLKSGRYSAPSPSASLHRRCLSRTTAAGTGRPSRHSRRSTRTAAPRSPPTWPASPVAGTGTTAAASPSRPPTWRASSPSAETRQAVTGSAPRPGRRRRWRTARSWPPAPGTRDSPGWGAGRPHPPPPAQSRRPPRPGTAGRRHSG